jgi:hypothetical protein
MSFTLDSPIEMTEKFEYVSIEYSVDELENTLLLKMVLMIHGVQRIVSFLIYY